MAEISHRGPGRPSLGDRKELKVRVHPDLKQGVAARARAKGLTENDYVAALIAIDIGRTELAPSLNQEVLPFSA